MPKHEDGWLVLVESCLQCKGARGLVSAACLGTWRVDSWISNAHFKRAMVELKCRIMGWGKLTIFDGEAHVGDASFGNDSGRATVALYRGYLSRLNLQKSSWLYFIYIEWYYSGTTERNVKVSRLFLDRDLAFARWSFDVISSLFLDWNTDASDEVNTGVNTLRCSWHLLDYNAARGTYEERNGLPQ